MIRTGCPHFRTFIGIDQTGAATQSGRSAKKLSAAIARSRGSRSSLEVEIELGTLRSLSPDSLYELTKSAGVVPSASKPAALLIDCVFGLPLEIQIGERQGALSLWNLMQQTLRQSDPAFGRQPGQQFFKSFLPNFTGTYPLRNCDRLARASSLFQTIPFQKNIQTGTYRIWRDIANEGKPWLHFWPFELRGGTYPWWAFESYPTFLWREVLGLKMRSSGLLRAAASRASHEAGLELRFNGWKSLVKHPDLADAFVIALSGAILQTRRALWEPESGMMTTGNKSQEGWILGLSRDGEESKSCSKNGRGDATLVERIVVVRERPAR